MSKTKKIVYAALGSIFWLFLSAFLYAPLVEGSLNDGDELLSGLIAIVAFITMLVINIKLFRGRQDLERYLVIIPSTIVTGFYAFALIVAIFN